MNLKSLWTAVLVSALCLGFAAAAGRPPTFPSRIVYVPNDRLTDAVTHGHVSGTGTNELIPRDMDLGVRVSLGRKDATPPVTRAEAHSTFGHVYLVEDGSGTLVLGGELVNPREDRPGEWTGSAVTGGREFHMVKGDMITVQVGMPHQWTEVPKGGVAYLAFHSFPEHNQSPARASR
jgi:mannose-6-phosphate isomerase-like protein (cupin superfamily)